MPGNMVAAMCGCGYEKDLYPGYSEITRKLKCIAYTKDGTDLHTFEDEKVDSENLQRVIDPFVMSDEEDEFVDTLDPENIKPEEMDKLRNAIFGRDAGNMRPIKCPRCKNVSLFLHQRGHWD